MTPDSPVDLNNLTAFEQRIHDLPEAEYEELYKSIMAKFPEGLEWLIVWRYCRKCKGIRPPRTHHCSISGKCVLRMDHYCPWVGNCVGMYNHKHFIMFLVHAVMGNITAFSIITINVMQNSFRKATGTMGFLMLYILSFTLFLALISFFGMHLYFIMTNSSSIEANALLKVNPFRHKRTKLQNMKDILGNNPRYWFFPWEPKSAEHPGQDGFNWYIRKVQ